MRFISLGLFCLVLATTGIDSLAAGPVSTVRPLEERAASVGSPTQGRLDGGVRLRETAFLHTVPYYAASGARWGLPSFISLLDRAAKGVARQYPGATLGVGDLSREHGGEVSRHRSHESGRDADLGYYLTDAAQRPVVPDRFLSVEPDGSVRDRPAIRFDDAKNWALIEGLVSGHGARVTQIFVAPHVRARLLRFAERRGVSAEVRERAAELMLQPRGVPLHDDHFHVRIACPNDEARICIETPVVVSGHARPTLSHPRLRAGHTPWAEQATVLHRSFQ